MLDKKAIIITPYKKMVGGVESVNKQVEETLKKSNYSVEYLSWDNFLENRRSFKIVIAVLLNKFLYGRKISRYDLVVCNGEWGALINKSNKIVICHGSYKGYFDNVLSNPTLTNRLSNWLLYYLQKNSLKDSKVVFVSNAVKMLYEDIYVRESIVINNTIDEEVFESEKADYSITSDSSFKYDLCMVANYNYYAKGFDIANALSNTYNICFVTNEAPENFKQHSNITIVNTTDGRFIRQILDESKILIHPSRFEACQLAPIEALASGKPVVISQTGIGEDLIHICRHFVVPRVDHDDLDRWVEKIQFLLSDHKKYCIEARKIYTHHYSKEVFENKWKNLLS